MTLAPGYSVSLLGNQREINTVYVVGAAGDVSLTRGQVEGAP